MRDEVAQLNTGKSPVEELAGETNTMVTDVMDIDRTPELMAWVFSGLFGRSPKQQPEQLAAAPSSASDQPTSPPSPSASSSPPNPAPHAAAEHPHNAAPAPTPSTPPPTSHCSSTADPSPGPSPSPSSSPSLELATVGGGCFWCLEACFLELRGVQSVISGYAGGDVPHPTYQQVCSKTTGHAEVVQIQYDPAVLSYRDILQVFMSLHDPTTPNRSGNDVGPQYRSIILTHDEAQAAVAAEVLAEADRGGWFGFRRRVVTELAPLREFYPAESYHQRYYSRNPGAGYCVFVVRPKLQEFRRKYAKQLRRDGAAAPL